MRAIGGLIWGLLSDRIGGAACVVGLALLWLMSLLPAESFVRRMALLSSYLLTFGIGYNGMAPVYASAVSDKFAGSTIP